ncbi:MAG: hypothetical protein KJ955_06855 [Nanoarchaeota archaeon]|nr:hypothetical protein [Nanoarchaeota archaeon]
MKQNEHLDRLLESFGIKLPERISVTGSRMLCSMGCGNPSSVITVASKGDDIRVFPACSYDARDALSSAQSWFEPREYIVGQYKLR